jgi:hypothetical protein
MLSSYTCFHTSDLVGVLLENGDLWFYRDEDSYSMVPEHSEVKGNCYKYVHGSVADFGVDYNLIVVLLKDGRVFFRHDQDDSPYVLSTLIESDVKLMCLNHMKGRLYMVKRDNELVIISYLRNWQIAKMKFFDHINIERMMCLDDYTVLEDVEGKAYNIEPVFADLGKVETGWFVKFMGPYLKFNENGLAGRHSHEKVEFHANELRMLKLFNWCQFVYVETMGDRIEVGELPVGEKREVGRKLKYVTSRGTDVRLESVCFAFEDFTFLYTYATALLIVPTRLREYVLPLDNGALKYDSFTNEIDFPEIQAVLSHRILKIGDFHIPRVPRWVPAEYRELSKDLREFIKTFVMVVHIKCKQYVPKLLCWYIMSMIVPRF